MYVQVVHTFSLPCGIRTVFFSSQRPCRRRKWRNWVFEKSYLIFARIASISFRRNARKVWFLTLPSEPTFKMNALMVWSGKRKLLRSFGFVKPAIIDGELTLPRLGIDFDEAFAKADIAPRVIPLRLHGRCNNRVDADH